MNVPQIEKIVTLVQVMHYIIQEGGKILVHCHAGLGRTGVAIACYILYAKMCPTWEAIRQVRQTRRHSIQNAKQKKFIKVFALCMQDLKILFPVPYQNPPLTLNQYIIKQEKLLNLQEKKAIGMCPKLIYEIVERLNLFVQEGLAQPSAIGQAIINGLAAEEEEILKQMKIDLNKWKWKSFFDCKEVSILVHLLFNFLDLMVLPPIQFSHIDEIWKKFFDMESLTPKAYGESPSIKSLSSRPEAEESTYRGNNSATITKLPQEVHLKKYMHSLSILECIPAFKTSLQDILEKPEHSILVQIVHLLFIFDPLPDEFLKDKICSRICISLFGLKDQECHCFLGERLLTTKFNNDVKISKLNNILIAWTTLFSSQVNNSPHYLKELSTDRSRVNQLTPPSSVGNILSHTVKSLMNMNTTDNLTEAGMYFGNILYGISTLPEDVQASYFQQFNGLLSEVSKRAYSPAHQPITHLEEGEEDSEEEGMGTPLPRRNAQNNMKIITPLFIEGKGQDELQLPPKKYILYIYIYIFVVRSKLRPTVEMNKDEEVSEEIEIDDDENF